MIDTNNDNITKNQTFIHQMHTNDDTNMITNDFDRYIFYLNVILIYRNRFIFDFDAR
jgi:hypothetical protein